MLKWIYDGGGTRDYTHNRERSENGLIDYYDRQSDFVTDFNWHISENFNINHNSLLDHHNLEPNQLNLSLNTTLLSTNFITSYRSIKDKLVADAYGIYKLPFF